MGPDDRYTTILLDAMRTSAKYQPKFGLGRDISLNEFEALYGDDPLYSWIGLDIPAMYSAHKAAGGITSIYRQLGIGCERLFRTLIIDRFDLTETQANWQYTIRGSDDRSRTLKLDGRIALRHLADSPEKRRMEEWLQGFKRKLDVKSDIGGAVFEVRQGYKSKDSKRQNADLANATNAYTQRYLPVLVVMSLQLDTDLRKRYEAGKWGVLSGSIVSDDPYYSTYAFCNHVINYDLKQFFERNTEHLREEVALIIDRLLAQQ
ncbi:MAG: hypothetical protein OXH22_10080 [Chloroflexi bacterium]|nr:hypothetical protein [Chloroflexota bacterium]